jgi:hypothetical protein
MSNRYNNGSYYDQHQVGAELQDRPEHAFRVAEQAGKQDHLSGHENSRLSSEHSPQAAPPEPNSPHQATTGHGIAAFGHKEISILAHELWRARGCPEGSPEDDWFKAARELRSRAKSR